MTKEMLINTVEGQECRIAIVNNSRLEELYIERVSNASHVGNIYKGRITNVEPSIQAAFVDFGLTKNGFLHISDINPSYFPKSRRSGESVGRKKAHRDRPPIQECLRRGQEVVVQLTKEGIGTKGPTMTTYLSIPGRLLVMMPGMSRLGVSRKIEDDEARDKARAILADLKPPQDIGFIVRTAAIDRPKREFQRDLNYLLRLWKSVKQRIQSSKSPAEIYQESDLVTRTIRDVYNTDISRILCDNQEVAIKVKEFLDVALPRTRNVISLYTGKEGLFHEYGLEQEIEQIYSRRLELPSGGSLVFDQAEALVAIDVNSGRFREHSDAETTATKINIEAAREISRQLRLRDLGGVVIIDFIDMREERNRRSVEKALRDEIRNDRAKTKVLKISSFGIVEMTRQRVRPSLKQGIFRTCTHCEGTGLIKNEESQSLLVMRNLQRACSNEQVSQIEVAVTPSVEYHLVNIERKRINDLETQFNKRILVKGDPALGSSDVKITCLNPRGSVVAWEQPAKAGPAQADKVATVSLDQILPPSPQDNLPEEDLLDEDLLESSPDESGLEPRTNEPTDQQAVQPQTKQTQPAAPALDRPSAPAGDRKARSTEPQASARTGDKPISQPIAPPPATPAPARAEQPAAESSAGAVVPAATGAGQQPPAAGQKRRRGRRGGRKHRARRERQALAAQQATQQSAAMTAQAQPAPATAPPAGEEVPSYERAARIQPSEEDEISEARELAIEQQALEDAAGKNAAPTTAADESKSPASLMRKAPPESQSAQAQKSPATAPAQESSTQAPGKRRRRRGGKKHRKGRNEQPADLQAKPSVEVPQSAPAEPPAVVRKTPTNAPPPGMAAAQGPRKGRPKAKKISHRQDKEYYEETLRRQKEAVRKPKDAIPDEEEEEDFTTEG